MGSAPSCLSVVHGHVSVRRYRGDGIDDDDLRLILSAAIRAPSGWNLQPYTIIVVRDEEKKRELAGLTGGQEHVREAPVFLVFALDYAKVVEAGERAEVKVRIGIANIYEALVDIGIAAGWALLAAESLGYGGCIVALYNNPCNIAEVLQLPPRTLPVIGLALGRPAEKPAKRRRQPMNTMVDWEIYGPSVVKAEKMLETYGAKAAPLFRHLFGPEGYYPMASEMLEACISRMLQQR